MISEYEQIQVRLLRSPDELPVPSDSEHPVTGVIVYTADSHFCLGFQTGVRTLRVRLHSDQLEALGRVLLDLAEERRLHGDV